MNVTFDSNIYRRVTDPWQFDADPEFDQLVAIHRAVKEGRIRAFLSATIVTLEAILTGARGNYLAANRLEFTFQDLPSDEAGRIRGRVISAPSHSLHPGLPDAFERWLEKSLAFGFRFLPVPRFGHPQPEILRRAGVMAPGIDMDYLDRVGEVCSSVEGRGAGMAVIFSIGERIKLHEGRLDKHWASVLNDAKNTAEAREIERAVAEWSDGDTVAVHVAYGCDILCTRDQAKRAGPLSVFAPAQRQWLSETYRVQIETPTGLAGRLPS